MLYILSALLIIAILIKAHHIKLQEKYVVVYCSSERNYTVAEIKFSSSGKVHFEFKVCSSDLDKAMMVERIEKAMKTEGTAEYRLTQAFSSSEKYMWYLSKGDI